MLDRCAQTVPMLNNSFVPFLLVVALLQSHRCYKSSSWKTNRKHTEQRFCSVMFWLLLRAL